MVNEVLHPTPFVKNTDKIRRSFAPQLARCLSIARRRANNAYMTSATQAEPPLGIPAATVVIFRNGENDAPPEILMQIRSRTMAFAGGMAVFPGGRVDDADFELAEKWIAKRGLTMPIHEAAHRIAAIRETLEEAGLALGMTGTITDQTAKAGREMLAEDNALAPVLEKFGWQLDLDAIIPFARWFPKIDFPHTPQS